MTKKPPNKDKISTADKELWDAYIKQEKITGVFETEKINEESQDFSKLLFGTNEKSSKEDVIPNNPKKIAKEKTNSEPAQLDKRTLEKLKKGKLPIEARIDLHGLNRTQAHEVLQKFIFNCHSKGKKCILVITGKGKPRLSTDRIFDREDGVLKKHVPLWLNESIYKNIVLRYAEAKPKDGGSGALYVYLRRRK